jgi:hypothetical protein
MQIVIAADCHGQTNRLKMLELAYPDADYYLHAGDLNGQLPHTKKWQCIRGETEEKLSMQETLKIDTPFGSIFMLHGHQLARKERIQQAAEHAAQKGCSIAVFGHSHQPVVQTVSNVMVINPGSLFKNRDGQSTYALLELTETERKSRIMFYFDLFDCRISQKAGDNIG